jgi:signal transduction histidine kinase/ActR/RegA family two-component response regulator
MDSPKELARHRGTKIALLTAAVIFAVMALNTLLHYWNISRIAESRKLVSHSDEKLRAANRLLTALQDAETGQRGFLLTGEATYLEPYTRSTSDIERHYLALQRLVEKSPSQQQAVTALGSLLTAKLNELRQSLTIHEEQGLEAARAFVRTDSGKQTMDTMRTILGTFEQDEHDTHQQLIELADQSTRMTVWLSLLAGLVALGIVGLIFYYLRRELLIREQFSKYLLEQDRVKSNFLAILGHELRNPLAAIRNSVDVLEIQDGSLPPHVEEIRAIIQRQTEVMVRLADDLMDTSRMTYSKLQLKLQPLNFSELLQRLISDARKTHRDDRIELEFHATNEPVWVDGDEARLTQVINNLLHNAYKFSRSGQTIRVEMSSPDPKTVQLAIRDQGLGIASDKLEEIFEPFTQSRRSDRKAGGLGLGLALVRGFVSLHGGTITAASEGPQRGSTFTMALPRVSQPHNNTVDKIEPCAEESRHCVIVIIDDRRDASYPLKRILEHMGHEIYIAADGTQGIELARQKKPDVVLCDIGLPGISGIEVARELRLYPETNDTYLVAITGYSAEEMREESQLAGFDAFLTKPVSRDGLHKIISALPCHVEA